MQYSRIIGIYWYRCVLYDNPVYRYISIGASYMILPFIGIYKYRCVLYDIPVYSYISIGAY